MTFFSISLYFISYVDMMILQQLVLPTLSDALFCQWIKHVNETDCTSLEHCVFNTFNETTGDCTGMGNQCERGWMGPGCQYVNLAINDINIDPMFDGNWTNFHSIVDATVNLNGVFAVSAINIFCYLTDIEIHVIIHDHEGNVCHNNSHFTGSPTVFLDKMTMTDKLLIKFTSYTKISEIEVFGGKNVAFSKETEQSSTYREKGVFLTSDKAVDGWNSNYEFSKISCTHTVPYKSNPYWKVNLGDFYAVMSILISNRDDSNRRRIDGFTLYGKTRDGTENLIYNDTNKSSSGRKEILIDSSYMLWEQVSQIIIKGEHISSEKILTLCEVFVFACIPVKTTSAYCLGFCPKNCHPEETCLNENFTCSQCIPGWTGPYCDQPIKCAKPVLSDRLHVTDDKQSYVYGEEIQFLCEIGFRLLGTTRATCGNGNSFNLTVLPVCETIKCAKPVLSDRLHVTDDKQLYVYGEEIQFLCEIGFRLLGTTRAICGNGNSFNLTVLPVCKIKKCLRSDLSSDHLLVVPDKFEYPYNTSVSFECEEGHFIKGSKSATCSLNTFVFPFDHPSCEAITCRRPYKMPEHMSLKPDKPLYAFNESINLGCANGFYLLKSLTLTCHLPDTFTQKIPNCHAISCPTPYLSENLEITSLKQSYSYQEVIHFRCRNGLQLHGINEAVCGESNKFNFTVLPSCEHLNDHLTVFITLGTSLGGICIFFLLFSIGLILYMSRREKKLKYSKSHNATKQSYHYTDSQQYQQINTVGEIESVYTNIVDTPVYFNLREMREESV